MIRKLSITFLGLMVVGFVALFYRDSRRIANYPFSSWEQDPSADCAVVLTGGSGRVKEGFDLLSRSQVKKLVISGVHPKASLREIFPVLPFYPSVNEENVILERRSTTTYGNAFQSASIIEALKCRSVVIVTSRTHMYRARRTFEGVLPGDIHISEHAVISGEYHVELFDVAFESLKSVFYSVWAY